MNIEPTSSSLSFLFFILFFIILVENNNGEERGLISSTILEGILHSVISLARPKLEVCF